jgi:hypothetical protein
MSKADYVKLQDATYDQLMFELAKRARPRHQANTTAKASTVKQAIIDVLEGRRVYAHACKAILHSGWHYVDPGNMMNKSPAEVQDFLESCAMEASLYTDMFATRRNLLKMIFDAYLRWERDN